MKNIDIDYVADIRGFEGLTQKDERLIGMLIEEVKKADGKKSIGFNATRRYLLTEEFDTEALKQTVEASCELTNSIGQNTADEYVSRMMKVLLERVVRDHVALDMVHVFRLAVSKLVEENKGNKEKTIIDIKNYFQDGRILPVSKSYIQACDYVGL